METKISKTRSEIAKALWKNPFYRMKQKANNPFFAIKRGEASPFYKRVKLDPSVAKLFPNYQQPI